MRQEPRFGSYDPDYGPYHGHPADPRTPSYDLPDEVYDEAQQRVFSHAIDLDEWLAEALGNGPDTSIDVSKLDAPKASTRALLVALFVGTDQQVLAAAAEMRGRAAAAMEQRIEDEAWDIYDSRRYDNFEPPERDLDDADHWY
jgi:hypothetical protein